jgi:hypothetical protein
VRRAVARAQGNREFKKLPARHIEKLQARHIMSFNYSLSDARTNVPITFCNKHYPKHLFVPRNGAAERTLHFVARNYIWCLCDGCC